MNILSKFQVSSSYGFGVKARPGLLKKAGLRFWIPQSMYEVWSEQKFSLEASLSLTNHLPTPFQPLPPSLKFPVNICFLLVFTSPLILRQLQTIIRYLLEAKDL